MYKLLGAAVALSLASMVWADEGSDKLDNPKPLPDDVSLPLPCEGQMVFRYVYIPVSYTHLTLPTSDLV